MSDFLSKIENFLFDILGLVLPGAIFLLILLSPISFIDIKTIPDNVKSNSYILSSVVTFFKILQIYWITDLKITLLLLIIIAYLIGHVVKVFSIIFYDFLKALFDKTINPFVKLIIVKLAIVVDKISNWLTAKSFLNTYIGKYFSIFMKPITNTISKIFVFDPPNFNGDNNDLKTQSIALLNNRLGTNYPDVWYSIYKLSTIIQQQGTIKSLASNFLAKYNLYRSLSFIFILTLLYYFFFFHVAIKYISPELSKITSPILIGLCILWFTFHYKYKRYWTLCGNETLVSLYYFLNKKKIDDI